MQKHSHIVVKAVALVGVIVTAASAGVEPSPFYPIFDFIIRLFWG